MPNSNQQTPGRIPIFRQAVEAYGLYQQDNTPSTNVIRRVPSTMGTPRRATNENLSV